MEENLDALLNDYIKRAKKQPIKTKKDKKTQHLNPENTV